MERISNNVINFDYLDRDINNDSTYALLNLVMDMMEDNYVDPLYRINKRIVHPNEYAQFKYEFDENIYDYLDTSIIKNGFRIFYCDKDCGYKHHYLVLPYGCVSGNGRTSLSYSIFITKRCANDENILVSLLNAILLAKMHAWIYEHYPNFVFDNDITNESIEYNGNLFYQAVLFRLVRYRVMDRMINLKYDDYKGRFRNCVFHTNKDKLIYNYALEEHDDNEDLKDLLYNILIESKHKDIE